MKKFMKLRQRGYDMLQISLGVAIILGLMVGTLKLFNQITNSTDLTELARSAVSVSSEVQAQYRTAANFDNIAADLGTGGVAAGSAFALRSGLPDDMLRNMVIAGSGQGFTLTMSGLKESVCERLAISNLGPNSTPDNTNCATGSLDVTYTR